MKKLLMVLLLALTACDAPQMKPESTTVLSIASHLRYFHDERTGECFAAVTTLDDVAFNHVQVTWVPCSPRVLAIIGGRK